MSVGLCTKTIQICVAKMVSANHSTCANVLVDTSNSITEENIPKDTAQGSNDEDNVFLKKGQRNSVVWRYTAN